MKQIYIEGMLGNLTPVTDVKDYPERPNHYYARVQETVNGYYEGEVVVLHRSAFVITAGNSEYSDMVRPYRVQKERANG